MTEFWDIPPSEPDDGIDRAIEGLSDNPLLAHVAEFDKARHHLWELLKDIAGGKRDVSTSEIEIATTVEFEMRRFGEVVGLLGDFLPDEHRLLNAAATIIAGATDERVELIHRLCKLPDEQLEHHRKVISRDYFRKMLEKEMENFSTQDVISMYYRELLDDDVEGFIAIYRGEYQE